MSVNASPVKSLYPPPCLVRRPPCLTFNSCHSPALANYLSIISGTTPTMATMTAPNHPRQPPQPSELCQHLKHILFVNTFSIPLLPCSLTKLSQASGGGGAEQPISRGTIQDPFVPGCFSRKELNEKNRFALLLFALDTWNDPVAAWGGHLAD